MSLPFTKNRPSPVNEGALVSEATHRSLALPKMVAYCEQTSSLRVLDLGRAMDKNIHFFTPYDARLTVADLFNVCSTKGLAQLDDDDSESRKRQRIFQEALPYDEESKFDLVLAWDLLNYLSPMDLDGFMERLKQYCRPGTLLFALIATRKQIPAEPRPFQILGPEQILYSRAESRQRPAPGYHEQELLRRLKGFRVDSRYLLRNGMQEYLFQYSISG